MPSKLEQKLNAADTAPVKSETAEASVAAVDKVKKVEDTFTAKSKEMMEKLRAGKTIPPYTILASYSTKHARVVNPNVDEVVYVDEVADEALVTQKSF